MDQVNVMLEPLRVFLMQFGEALPRLIFGALVVLAGWLVAKAVRLGTIRTLKSINFHVLSERAGIDRFLQQGGTPTDSARILGELVYWLVIVAALILAFNGLGWVQVTALLERAAILVLRVMLAMVILAFGFYFARFAGASTAEYFRGANIADATAIGRLVRFGVMVFVTLIALDQLNIGADIIRQSFLIILAGVVFALALAFGLGGRAWAAALLERVWPSKDARAAEEKRRKEDIL
jgi:hypothetical protein